MDKERSREEHTGSAKVLLQGDYMDGAAVVTFEERPQSGNVQQLSFQGITEKDRTDEERGWSFIIYPFSPSPFHFFPLYPFL